MNDSFNVPLKASFGGLKVIPWIAWGSNSIGPRLILCTDHIEYRLFKSRSKPYSKISRVDYRKAIGTENIVLEFNDSIATFIGNAGTQANAQAAIRLLHAKGCLLSDRASELLLLS